jgi:hypothetical protein
LSRAKKKKGCHQGEEEVDEEAYLSSGDMNRFSRAFWQAILG